MYVRVSALANRSVAPYYSMPPPTRRRPRKYRAGNERRQQLYTSATTSTIQGPALPPHSPHVARFSFLKSRGFPAFSARYLRCPVTNDRTPSTRKCHNVATDTPNLTIHESARRSNSNARASSHRVAQGRQQLAHPLTRAPTS